MQVSSSWRKIQILKNTHTSERRVAENKRNKSRKKYIKINAKKAKEENNDEWILTKQKTKYNIED